MSAKSVAPQKFIEEAARSGEGDDEDPFAETRRQRIVDRQSDYQKRAHKRRISPERADPFVDQTPNADDRTYAQIMQEAQLERDKDRVEREMVDKYNAGELVAVEKEAAPEKRVRFDGGGDATPSQSGAPRRRLHIQSVSAVAEVKTPHVERWDETPARIGAGDATPATGAQWGATPSQSARRNRWDETPKAQMDGGLTPGWGAETPYESKSDLIESKVDATPSTKRRSRWDLTPSQTPGTQSGTDALPNAATPNFATPLANGESTPMLTPGGSTPIGTVAMAMKTPAANFVPMTPEQVAMYKWEREIESRNQQLTDEELDALFPPGYRVLQPPAGYAPIRTPSRKLLATPTPMSGAGAFMIPATPERGGAGDKAGAGGIM